MTNSLNIKLVPPSVWRYITDNAFWGLPIETVRKAYSIMGTLQTRHIGVTPKLAAGLAALIIDPYIGRQTRGCWDDVLKRLEEEITGKKQFAGVIPGAHPFYSIHRLAGPLIEEACQRINMNYLFCQDEIESDATPDEYDTYSKRLEIEIKKMAETREESFQLFWIDRAITSISYSRGAFQWEHIPEGTPETDLQALDLMLSLKTNIPKPKTISPHPKPMIQPLKHRETNKTHEGGFSGIHTTRRQEDIGDILLSEFINPPLVLAERLTGSGFLALRRQPKRENLRDILLVGMAPGEIQPKPAKDFIKTCWMDLLSRLGILLLQSGRVKSEFRWLESDEFGRTGRSHFLLQNLPPEFIDIPTTSAQGPTLRRDFLTAMGWLPQYLDSRERFQKPKKNRKEWAFSEWRNQKENPQWTGNEEKRLDTGLFSVVHIMLFLPAKNRLEDKISSAARLGSYYHGFGIGNTPGRTVGITWVPEKINNIDEWAVDFKRTKDLELFPNKKTGWDIHRIAGRLVEVWRDYIIEELRHG